MLTQLWEYGIGRVKTETLETKKKLKQVDHDDAREITATWT